MAHPACSCPCSPVSFLHPCASCRGQAICLDDDAPRLAEDGKDKSNIEFSLTRSVLLSRQAASLDDDGKDKAWQTFQHWEL